MKKILTGLIILFSSAAVFSQPTGSIIAFAGKVAPAGWEICDGKEVSKNDPKYRNLFRTIGNTWGGDENPNFKLPNLKGQFLMGVETTAEVAASGGAASHNHGGKTSHAFEESDGYHADPDGRQRAPQCTGLAHKHTISTESNLPPFKKVLYIIKL